MKTKAVHLKLSNLKLANLWGMPHANFSIDLNFTWTCLKVLLNCLVSVELGMPCHGKVLLTWSTKHMPGHVGVNMPVPCGIYRCNWAFFRLGISHYKFYCAICCVHRYPNVKNPGMKLENWHSATSRTLAQVSTTQVYIKHSSRWLDWACTLCCTGYSLTLYWHIMS